MTICLFSCPPRSLAHECHTFAPGRLQLPPSPPCHLRHRCSPLRFPDAHDTLTRNFPHKYRLVSSDGRCSSHSRKFCSQVASSRRKRCRCGTSAFPRCLFRVYALKFANVNFAFCSGSSPNLLGTGAFAKCGQRGLKRRHKYATPDQRCCRRTPSYRQRLFLAVGSPRLVASAHLRHLILPRRTWLRLVLSPLHPNALPAAA